MARGHQSWLRRVLRRLRAVLFGGATLPAGGRQVPAGVGPAARRRLEALAHRLPDDDWASLVTLGLVEHELRALASGLRPPSHVGRGRAAAAAEALRHDVDMYLSEPDGPYARALQHFPAADVERSRQAAARVEARGRAIAAEARELLAAVRAAETTRVGLGPLRARYAVALPGVWAELDVDGYERRLADAVAPRTVSRLATEVDEISMLLARRHGALATQAERLRAELVALGVGDRAVDGNMTVATADDLERVVPELRAALLDAGSRAVEAAHETVDGAAGSHLAYLHRDQAHAFERTSPAEQATALRLGRGLEAWAALRATRVRRVAPTAPNVSGADSTRRRKRVVNPEAIAKRMRENPRQLDVFPDIRPKSVETEQDEGGHHHRERGA